MRRLLLFLFAFFIPIQVYAQIRVNVGGPSYTDTKGQVWAADNSFNNGAISGCASAANVTGTTDPTLFKSARIGTSSSPELQYTFPVANGNYQVNLYFAETCTGQAVGSRVFDVQMQGFTVFPALDIFATVGANISLLKSANVTVSNGSLIIRFVHIGTNPNNNPIVYAIEVLPVAANPPPLQIVITKLGTFTFPTVVAGQMQLPFCGAADGTCTMTMKACMPDGVTCITGLGTVYIVKSVTLPAPQILTMPIVAVTSP